jgi:hypothetical protein
VLDFIAREITRNVRELVLDYLAVGIDPSKSTIYLQSLVPEVTELFTIFSMLVNVPRLQRVPTLKEVMHDLRISTASLYLGNTNIIGGVRYFISDGASEQMHRGIAEAFERGNILRTVKLIEEEFAPNHYSFDLLFKDEKRRLMEKIMEPTISHIDHTLRQACDGNCAIIDTFREMQLPVPRKLQAIVSYRVNSDMEDILSSGDIPLDRFLKIIGEAERWSVVIDRDKVSLLASTWVNRAMEEAGREVENVARLHRIAELLKALRRLSVPLNLWKSQNIYYYLDGRFHAAMQERAKTDSAYRDWVATFHRLGEQLRMHDRG